MIYVLYLDRYHLGDPLFLTGFARDVAGFAAPLILVHGGGEAAERALEAQGRFPPLVDGVAQTESTADREIVTRAARDLNRQITHTLNDAGVAAVGLEAAGRGLVRFAGDGIEVGETGWLRDLVGRSAVPVMVALLADPEGGVREANGGAVAGALAHSLTGRDEPAEVLFLAKSGQIGLITGDQWEEGADVPEPKAVRAAIREGARVRLTGRSGLRGVPIEDTYAAAETEKKTP